MNKIGSVVPVGENLYLQQNYWVQLLAYDMFALTKWCFYKLAPATSDFNFDYMAVAFQYENRSAI